MQKGTRGHHLLLNAKFDQAQRLQYHLQSPYLGYVKTEALRIEADFNPG